MQNKTRSALAAFMIATLLAAPLAEARRAGAGKSYGMSRSQSSSQSYNQSNSYNRSNQNNNAPTQQPQRSGSNVGGMVAAGVGGAALGAVAANAMANDRDPNQQNNQKQGGISWFWIILLGFAAFFLFRKFTAKKQLANANPYAPNRNGNDRSSQGSSPFSQPTARNSNTNIFGQPIGGGQTNPQTPFGGATMSSGNALPDGTEPATFLRFARQRFNHIQSMNSASNIEEIRRYFIPQMYQAIQHEIVNNDEVAEFSNLTANIVDHTSENGEYIVSVRFTGTVSESLNSLPQPFSEIWHFVKPIGSSEEWLVAGIQQQ